MFRGLSLLQATEGFEDHTSFVVKQTNTFTKKYPNSYLTSQTDPSLLNSTSSGLGVWDPNTRQVTQKDTELKNLYMTVDTNRLLQEQAAQCAAANIDSLIGSQSLNSKVRCGWIYKKGTPGSQPQVSQGVLGTRSGPAKFVNAPSGTYYWDLDAAKKQILKDRCGALVNCANVGTAEFANCAYSSTRGIGVPVDSGGSLLYPRDPSASAPTTSLITNPGSCPPPASPLSPQYAHQQSRDSCIPLPNGKLSRDCMLQQITAAGCKQDGTLYQSLLNDAQPANFAAGLENVFSYKKYQQVAQVPLMDLVIKDGSTTKDIAMGNFKELNKQSQVVNQSGLSFASRDLCLKKGLMDSYDFCNELSDSSTPPFNLECLQKIFRRLGGQPAGKMYPTAANKESYDSLANWGAVKAKIIGLANTANASVDSFVDGKTQRNAIINFLGITPEPLDNSYIAGDLQNPGHFFDSGSATQRFRLWINKLLAPNFPSQFIADAKASYDAGNGIEITVKKVKDGSSKTFLLTSFIDGGYYWQVESTGREAYQYGQIYTEGEVVFFTFKVLPPPKPKCSSPNVTPPESVSGWKYMGCYRDCTQGRGLPNRLGNVNSIEQCIAQAKAAGYNTSGNQYFGECWAGNNTDWDKMGDAGCCESIGGHCTQQIYQDTNYKPPPQKSVSVLGPFGMPPWGTSWEGIGQIPTQGNPQWIWNVPNADKINMPNGFVTFNYIYKNPGVNTQARLWVAADNIATVFINGAQVGGQIVSLGAPMINLISGDNKIKIVARNDGGPCGLLVNCINGSSSIFVSNGEWTYN